MTHTTRLWISCAVLVTACAGDNRLDPSDLELRDLLGVSPEIAGTWDRDQRAAARSVIDAGLRERHAAPGRAAFGGEPALDPRDSRSLIDPRDSRSLIDPRDSRSLVDPRDSRSLVDPRDSRSLVDPRVARSLAAIDVDRARHRTGALGAVAVAIGGSDLVATPRAATLAPHAAPRTEIQLRGWDGASWSQLPARGMDVLAGLAGDAGHPGGPLVVAASPQLAVVAGYLPATASIPAQLVVNPVALAALEPPERASAAGAPSTGLPPSPPAVAAHAQSPSPAPPGVAANPAAAADSAGNPYSFYGSVAECAAAERDRCEACLASNRCTAVTPGADGNAECRQLAADGGRGYYLICINLALAIDAIASCAERDAPSCARDRRASESLASLAANAAFLDDAACGGPLDACLATQYGPPSGGFPGPGSDPGTSPRPRHTSMDCGSAACNDNVNCDGSPNCELDGPSCDSSSDGGCSDSSDSSGCGGDGGGGTSDSCSGDAEDSCGAGDNSSCDSSDCGGGGDSCDSGGGDCGGGGGGDCSGGGGGDCGGGGGGCSGGGGDCSGGGGDCNVAHRRGHAGPSLPIAVGWALLPIPFATWVRRRAKRRLARAAADAAAAPTDGDPAADREVAP